ncbi:Uncharacterised protein [uncultured archaeon]|nr:Uncharacterised protein [uncultured archaeon]
MAVQKKVYTNPKSNSPLLSTISSGCKTPLLDVKFCCLVNPYRYPNSPLIPRYSITCVVNPQEEMDFLAAIQAIEKDEGVETVIKSETEKKNDEWVNTGNILVKFQTKNQIPIYLADEMENGKPVQIALEDELGFGEKVKIIYDILRYTKRTKSETTQHGLSFKPTAIYYYPKD